MLRLADEFTEAAKLKNLRARLAEGNASILKDDLVEGEQFFKDLDAGKYDD